ncbi:MAG: PfkB family carbohydrate kinase [Bacteroidota bacterium]
MYYDVLTAGASNSTVYTKDEISRIDIPKVKVVDTVGVGDAFTGAFASALIAGKPIKEAHQFSIKKAAFICTQEGAWPIN